MGHDQRKDQHLSQLAEWLLATQDLALYKYFTYCHYLIHDHAIHFSNWHDICEVAKMVHGYRSDNHTL